MTRYWLVSSKDISHIKTAYERLMWGFWDRDIGEKLRQNWRRFIRTYDMIKPHDILIFQIARTGDIHGIGLVKDKFYDEETPVWEIEIERRRVLFPWRISLWFMIFSEEPILAGRFIRASNYIDGYGLGEITEHDFRAVCNALNERLKNVRLSIML